ncbi:rCG63029 [Rattus norvegicus]|nr:rCG63029 [Rattus norvegicus]
MDQQKDHEKAEFERDPTKQYGLKMKTSSAIFSEVERRFDALQFTGRAFEDEKKARMGIVDCAKHQLLQPFNVLCEKEGGTKIFIGGDMETKFRAETEGMAIQSLLHLEIQPIYIQPPNLDNIDDAKKCMLTGA